MVSAKQPEPGSAMSSTPMSTDTGSFDFGVDPEAVGLDLGFGDAKAWTVLDDDDDDVLVAPDASPVVGTYSVRGGSPTPKVSSISTLSLVEPTGMSLFSASTQSGEHAGSLFGAV